MGYEVHRFHGDVDPELLCPICGFVLEEPLQIPKCEHAFCVRCIHTWLTQGNRHEGTCPVDRNPVLVFELVPVPRILKNLLSKLRISCDNVEFGCQEEIPLGDLRSHLASCECNPKRLVACPKGCGVTIAFDERQDHNCVRELNSIIQLQNEKLNEVQTQLDEQRQQLNEQRDDINNLKMLVSRSMSIMNFPRNLRPNLHTSTSPAVGINEEVHQWLPRLELARVTRWGGMISTPDAVLQAMIRRSLADTGCPPAILNDLMENAHERKWPHGLSTLETRQLNRRRYEQFLCRRIPGKQAVVIMACENQHMGESMSVEPGIVMIFAHGIEGD